MKVDISNKSRKRQIFKAPNQVYIYSGDDSDNVSFNSSKTLHKLINAPNTLGRSIKSFDLRSINLAIIDTS